MGHAGDLAPIPWDAQAAAELRETIAEARRALDRFVGQRRLRADGALRQWRGPARRAFDDADWDVRRLAQIADDELDQLARDLGREEAAIREENGRRRAEREALERRDAMIIPGCFP